jgi:hypothetical protein
MRSSLCSCDTKLCEQASSKFQVRLCTFPLAGLVLALVSWVAWRLWVLGVLGVLGASCLLVHQTLTRISCHEQYEHAFVTLHPSAKGVVLLQAFAELQASANWSGLKEERICRVKNGLLDVNKHSHWLRLRLLMTANHSWTESITGLETATTADVEASRRKILECCHLEALIEGNISAECSKAMCKCVDAVVALGLPFFHLRDCMQPGHA